MEDEVLELETMGALYQAKIRHPHSEGLVSLETYLYGSTCISTEGLVSKIKDKCNRMIDKIVAKLNGVVAMFTELTHEQEKVLENLKKGEATSEETKILPISRGAITGFLKFLGMVAAWFAVKSFAKYSFNKLENQRDKERADMAEKAKFSREAKRLNDMLTRKKERMGLVEAEKTKLGMFQSLKKSALNLKERTSNINWDDVERAANETRDKADSIKAPTRKQHEKRNLLRSGFVVAVLVGWYTLSVVIIGKVVVFFRRIAKALGMKPKEDKKNDDHDSYDDF